MNTWLKIIFVFVLVFSVYHLFRDILQILEVENILTNVFHWQHTWCGAYCNYVSLPPEIGAIVGSVIVLRRDRIGIIGILTLVFPPILLLLTLLLP